MTRIRLAALVGLSLVAITWLVTGSALAAVTATVGNWNLYGDNSETVQPYYDAAYTHGTYNNRMVEVLYKTKFMEVGEKKSTGGTAYLATEWTRFDFDTSAALDKRMGQTSFRYVASGGGYGCYDVIEAKYEGTYTQQDGTVQTITYSQLFKYISNTCDGWGPENYFLDANAASLQGSDHFFWRIVTVQNPHLGNVNCVTTQFNNYNGAATGTMVTIADNSLGPTPGGNAVPSSWAYYQNGGNSYYIKYYMPIGANNHANDLVATYNINVDTRWLFDRGLGELLHDASATESGSTIADTTCVNLVVMFEYQTLVFYDEPASSYSVLQRHTLQGF